MKLTAIIIVSAVLAVLVFTFGPLVAALLGIEHFPDPFNIGIKHFGGGGG